MTLLQQIIQTSSTPLISNEPLKYPIPLSSDSILSTLQIDPTFSNPNPTLSSLLNPLTGFQITPIDSSLAELNTAFFKKLKGICTVKAPLYYSAPAFIEVLNPFLEKIGVIKFGGLYDVEMGAEFDDYTCSLITKFGSFVARDVMELVIESCFAIGNWKILQTIIVCKLVDYESRSGLLSNLVAKNRSDLICLCVRVFRVMKPSDLCMMLKYFISPSKESLVSMIGVRKDWENEALFAIRKASDLKLTGNKMGLLKEVAMLFTIAYDEFSSWELCLHHLVSSSVDDIVFLSAITKLSVDEMLRLIRYLGKWLRKYEKFPEAELGREAAVSWGVVLAPFVPRFEDVVKCLGLLVDEHFSLLAMHSEFRDELKAIEEVVSSLALDGKHCSSISSLISILKPGVVGA
ncbi:uncharacterized protein LOC141600934 [Silene latifolia]|uniref:uncharacterized protein LOC141600934 n=1 Tax=Silene latifolia TaxID=37657 RepID=UPI003D77837C